MSTPESSAGIPPSPSRRNLLLWNGLGIAVVFAAILAAIGFWANTQEFEDLVRGRMIAQLSAATGGRVEIRAFHWRPFDLEAEADGIVIHGLEDPGDAPYAQLESLHVGIRVIGLLSPRVLLRDVEVVQPQFHLIFYPNGSTNQPQPRKPRKLKEPPLDTLFDLQAGHIAVERGTIDIDNRAASFDFQNRYLPLDFQANDTSLVMRYVAAVNNNPETYQVQIGVRDLSLLRGGTSPAAPPPVHGFLQASLDLSRNAAILRSLRLTTSIRDAKDRTLSVSGNLLDFNRPRWQAKATGELDLRLLNPIVGYPFAPEGIARVNISGAGETGEFRFDGTVHIDGGAYVAPGVVVRDLRLDTNVHADQSQLRVTSIVAHFAQGGQMRGEVLLDQWLPHLKGQAQLQPIEAPAPAGKSHRRFWNRPKTPLPPPPPQPPPNTRDVLVKAPQTDITANGKIAARFDDVALDTVLDVVGQKPFKRLGLNTLLNGPATANWTNGDVNTLKVDATLDLKPSPQSPPQEAPTTGLVDATYSQHDGSVDLRRLDLTLPGSRIQAHGHLGAYPQTSSTNMGIDFQSHNLGEFDTVLRDLGLQRNGKSGAAALPVALSGQAEFHGAWSGSLVSPWLSGDLKATQLALELPSPANEKSTTTQLVQFDSLDVNGTYAADRIAIVRAQAQRGNSRVTVDGTLSAPSIPAYAVSGGIRKAIPGSEMPAFDSASLLHARVHAASVDVGDVLPVLGLREPVSGTIDAQFETDGPLRAPGGSGWVELDNGVVYGEPLTKVRAQGSLANEVVKVTSFSVAEAAGGVAGSGTYDIRSRRFQADAHGAGIDIAKIERLRSLGQTVAGRLGFSVTASGTVDDPQIEGRANLADLSAGGEPLGALDLTAHTLNHALLYDVTTHMEASQLTMHGQTVLHGEYPTQAKLDFSQLNVGVLLRLAHVEGITGESALAGSANLQGPLAHPAQMQGDARLQALAVTVAGVHLQSDGGVHASLADTRITLDPLHVIGDQTDLHLNGTLGLKDTQRLDFEAGGSVNLKLAETLDRDLTAGGTTTFHVEAHGPLANPGLRGLIEFDNGSLSLEDLPNGLSQLHGTLEFNQNRLEVRSLTAMTGGGQLSLGGYLSYQHGLYADLSVTGKGIRIRYPPGVSSLADATLHLQGTQPNLLLSGNVLVTRFSVSSDLDIASLAAQATAVQPVAQPNAPSNHIRLNVRIQSSPQLNFQNAYAKLAGDVDLRLRGTLASPSLLGRVSITEGNAVIAGTRYELQRGDVVFTNPVRIQPTIDLNATARVEDYDITLGLHGTPDKLGITYRSDPPLPEADVVALLALGRTQSEQGLYTQQQQQSVGPSPSTDVLLGGALNATVSSRVQKLFGAGSVKVDPNYLGALGNSTTRITVDEQLGKNVTLTYATNVDTSAQQLLQAEIAVNRHVSLLVARDESGVFSMVVKATRRYR